MAYDGSFVNVWDRIWKALLRRVERVGRESVWQLTPRSYWLREAQRHIWVFVMGCNRSGKTSLANLLGVHPLVRVVPNANFHTRAVRSSDSHQCRHVWTEKLDSFRLTEDDDSAPASRLAFDWLHYAPSRPAMVIESDLPSVQMRWLQAVFTNSYFVGVVRNGYAVAEGIRRKEGYAIRRCARQWNLATKTMMADAGRMRRFRLVRYEELMSRPAHTIRTLGSWLGIDPEPIVPVATMGWRMGNTDRDTSYPRNANLDLIQSLSASELDEITREAAEMLEQLGYPLLSAGGELRERA